MGICIDTFIKPDNLPLETSFKPSNELGSFITKSSLTSKWESIVDDTQNKNKKEERDQNK